MLVCEKCGRKGEERIESCPYLVEGNCSFLKSQEKLFPLLGLIVLCSAIAGFGVFLVGGIAFLIEGTSIGYIFSLLCFLPLILSSILAILLGIIFIFAVRERLDNPSNGASLQKVWFLRFDIFHLSKSAVEPLTFRFQTYSPITHPPSLIAIYLHPPDSSPRSMMYWNKYACEILMTSLIYLMAENRLIVYSSLLQRSFLRGRIKQSPQKQYFFAPGEGMGVEEAEDELELRIMSVVETWSIQKGSRKYLHGISAYQLAIQLMEKVRWNPGRWIYQQIQQKAEMFKLPTSQSILHNLHKDGQWLEDQVEGLKKSHPDFVAALRSGLRSGMSHMEWKYEGEP